MSRRRRAIWLGVPKDARDLVDAGDGLKYCVFRARSVGGEGNALAGAVEAGVDANGLAFGEGADGEGFGCDAGGGSERGCRALGGDAATGGSLPGDGLVGKRNAVGENESLDGPSEGGAGGEGKLRCQGGQDGRGPANELRLEAGAVG